MATDYTTPMILLLAAGGAYYAYTQGWFGNKPGEGESTNTGETGPQGEQWYTNVDDKGNVIPKRYTVKTAPPGTKLNPATFKLPKAISPCSLPGAKCPGLKKPATVGPLRTCKDTCVSGGSFGSTKVSKCHCGCSGERQTFGGADACSKCKSFCNANRAKKGIKAKVLYGSDPDLYPADLIPSLVGREFVGSEPLYFSGITTTDWIDEEKKRYGVNISIPSMSGVGGFF